MKVKVLGRRAPVVVTWAITNRCNYQCKYCDRWQRDSKDISTDDALAIIDQLSRLGCVRISFSGGEPLLREDLEIILNYCKEKQISSTLISNGSLVVERIKQLINVDLLELSLDGPRQVNDFARSEGAFDRTLTAAKAARDKGIKFFFNTTLTKYNLDCVGYMLDVSSEYNTGVMFGPASYIHSCSKTASSLMPGREEFYQTIDKLLYEKRKGKPVLNSASALKYMKAWPNPGKISCYAGRAFCHIGADGRLYNCVAMEQRIDAPDCINTDFEEAFNKLFNDTFCNGCWCTGTLEFNRLLALKPSVISTFSKLR